MNICEPWLPQHSPPPQCLHPDHHPSLCGCAEEPPGWSGQPPSYMEGSLADMDLWCQMDRRVKQSNLCNVNTLLIHYPCHCKGHGSSTCAVSILRFRECFYFRCICLMVHTCLLRSQSCPCRVQGAAVLRWNRRRWWVRAARAVRWGWTYASQGSSAAYRLWFKKHMCIQMQCYVIVMLLTAPAPRKALAHRLEKQQCKHFTKNEKLFEMFAAAKV